MKKFIVLFLGRAEPTPEMMEPWQRWFAAVGPSLLDPGSPLGPGREITRTGAADLAPESGSPVTGYTIVGAASMEAAEKLLEGLPIIDGLRIYEAMSM